MGHWGIWGFIGFRVPKTRDTFLGVPVVRIIVHVGVYIGIPRFWETTTCGGSAKSVRGMDRLPFC